MQDSLNLISHVADACDHDYKRVFLSSPEDSLVGSNIFWSVSKSAAAVSLTDQQMSLFRIRIRTAFIAKYEETYKEFVVAGLDSQKGLQIKKKNRRIYVQTVMA